MKKYQLHNLLGIDGDGQPTNQNFNKQNNHRKTIDSLIGMCEGLLADGRLDNSEIEFLDGWIAAHPLVSSEWPASVIAQNLRAVLDDGQISEDERAETMALLASVCATEDQETGQSTLSTTLPLDAPPPQIVFPGHTYCLTGKFVTGTRRQCEGFVTASGGKVHPRVNHGVNYLVIGTFASRDWKHTSHGRKIEAAVEAKDQGHAIAIVSEQHWVKSLNPTALYSPNQ